MKREDLEKLIGGFVSDTLSEAERTALFEAALRDQELFDALARADALREVLEHTESRRAVLAALEETPVPAWRRAVEWFSRPQAWGLAGGLAATVALAVLMVRVRTEPQQLVQLAKRQDLPAAMPSPAPAEAAAPASSVEPAREKRKSFAPPREGDRAAGTRDLPPPPPLLAAERLPAAEPPQALPAAPDAPPSRLQPAFADAALEVKQERLAATGRVVVQLTPQQLYDLSVHQVGAVEPMQFVPAQKAGERAEARSRAPAAALAARPVGLLPHALGLRYTIEQKGEDNTYSAAATSALRPGEPVRLKIESNEAAYLYVFAGDRQLFSGRVQPRRPFLVEVPDGTPAVRIVLARQSQIAARQLAATSTGQLAESAGKVAYLVNTSPQPEAVVVAEVPLGQR